MLIGLNGKAGSGKDTAYEFMAAWGVENRRLVRRDAFADRLKISAARALGHGGSPKDCIEFCNSLKMPYGMITVYLPTDKLDNPSLQISGREFLQRYGTEAHRDIFGKNFWVDAVIDRYREIFEPGEILVVTDVRFDNEAQAIREAGGEVWRIVRDAGILEDSHASEQPISEHLVDYTIGNHGSLDSFRDSVLSVLERKVYA